MHFILDLMERNVSALLNFKSSTRKKRKSKHCIAKGANFAGNLVDLHLQGQDRLSLEKPWSLLLHGDGQSTIQKVTILVLFLWCNVLHCMKFWCNVLSWYSLVTFLSRALSFSSFLSPRQAKALFVSCDAYLF